MEQLVAIGELPVEEKSSEQAKYGERCRKDPRQEASCDQQTPAKLKSNDGREQHVRHAKLLHVGCGPAIVADDAPALMHENQGQEQSAYE